MSRKTMRQLGLGALLAMVCVVGCDGNGENIDAGMLPDVPNLPDVPLECTRDLE